MLIGGVKDMHFEIGMSLNLCLEISGALAFWNGASYNKIT